MADPITEEDSVLTLAIKDMSFNPWQADPTRLGTPAQKYNAQMRHWMDRLQREEPWSLGIFVENYPARSDIVGGVALGAAEPAPPALVQENHLSEHGLPTDVAEYVRQRRAEGVDVTVHHVPAPDLTKREEVLREANRIIHGDREKDYGRPIDSFTRLAEALNLVLRPKLREGVELDAVDAAVLMIAMKLSRLAGGDRKDDTWVDLAGYSALGAEVRDQL
ncbi:hypothetical protein QDW23_gp25 [Microbacterium phage Stromboli]|uniref:hypothetical protein n=1 Tax=Microbacterium phage Stromboli TaxID=2713263 RepID=UPI0014173A4F|nr:hypothetical protein QDW23_gp25 [Microbacterium phage Stromboli]QIN93684.1 hypothetical protein SEA_STROMBOLI_25 [Microbacterium phage Stromboli]